VVHKSTLPERDQDVLQAVVEQYISTAGPVGSLELSRGQKVSSATVRNAMARLEADGYLLSPHASAGRMPTHQGVRYYLDELMPQRRLTAKDRSRVAKQVLPEQGGALSQTAARGLAEMAEQIGILAPPRAASTQVGHIEFIRVAAQRFAAVMVMRDGDVQHRVVSVSFDLDTHELERINAYMREMASGTLSDIREHIATELRLERAREDALYRHALELGQLGTGAGGPELVVEGAVRCFMHPEFATDTERMRQVLRALDEKALLLELLDRVAARGVTLGEELGDQRLQGMAVVAASYESAGGGRGVIGLLGPMRMDYARLVPLVEFSARAMTRHLLGTNE
jgi:heat-inducible transcriptional repressor